MCIRDRSVTGGIRYDRGRIDITAFEDPYLVEYLSSYLVLDCSD